MDLIAARTGGRREFRERLQALVTGLAVFLAHIDAADVHLGRRRLYAQRPACKGRLGGEAA
jgi:hypothetical protein